MLFAPFWGNRKLWIIDKVATESGRVNTWKMNFRPSCPEVYVKLLSHWIWRWISGIAFSCKKLGKDLFFFCSGTLLLLFIWFTFDIWERGTSEVHFLCLLADSQSTEDVFFCLLDLLAPLVFVPSRRNVATKTQDKGAQFDSKPADLKRSFFFAESFLPFLSHSWPEATGVSALEKKKEMKTKRLYKSVCDLWDSGMSEMSGYKAHFKIKK